MINDELIVYIKLWMKEQLCIYFYTFENLIAYKMGKMIMNLCR